MLRADEEFSREEQARELTFEERQELAIQWVCRIGGVFAREACDLAESDAQNWELSKVESRVNEIVRHLVLEASHSKFVGGRRPQFLSERGQVRDDVLAEIYKSPELVEYRQKLIVLLDEAAAPNTISSGAEGASPSGPRSKAERREKRFPARAAWLRERLRERSWNKHDVARQLGPDHKSVQKILNGYSVSEDVLEKLARALSKGGPSKIVSTVDVVDIPVS
jgi:hypothetical protein